MHTHEKDFSTKTEKSRKKKVERPQPYFGGNKPITSAELRELKEDNPEGFYLETRYPNRRERRKKLHVSPFNNRALTKGRIYGRLKRYHAIAPPAVQDAVNLKTRLGKFARRVMFALFEFGKRAAKYRDQLAAQQKTV